MTNPKTKTEINENGCIKVTKNNDELEYEYIPEEDFGLSQYTNESLLSLYDAYKKPITTNGTNYLKNLSTLSDETMAQLRGFDNGWNKEYLSFDGVDDNVEVGYKNREFSDGITFEIVVKINEIKTTEFFGNWEGAGGGLGYNSSGEIYFNLFLVKPEKYSAVADVKPIAVVKHANVTIKDKTTFPGVPSKATVIATINADCDTSTPY